MIPSGALAADSWSLLAQRHGRYTWSHLCRKCFYVLILLLCARTHSDGWTSVILGGGDWLSRKSQRLAVILPDQALISTGFSMPAIPPTSPGDSQSAPEHVNVPYPTFALHRCAILRLG